MREYYSNTCINTGVGAEKEEGGDEEKRRRVAIRRVAANVVIEKSRVEAAQARIEREYGVTKNALLGESLMGD